MHSEAEAAFSRGLSAYSPKKQHLDPVVLLGRLLLLPLVEVGTLVEELDVEWSYKLEQGVELRFLVALWELHLELQVELLPLPCLQHQLLDGFLQEIPIICMQVVCRATSGRTMAESLAWGWDIAGKHGDDWQARHNEIQDSLLGRASHT